MLTAKQRGRGFEQSGRSVNLRTPSCHGKRRVAGTRSYASYRDRFRPKTCRSGRRSSRAESRVTIDRLLSCFFFLVEIEPSSQMNSANPTAESSSCDLRDEMARRMRRSLKTGGSIQAQSQRGKTLKKRVW